jgi:hypothetical protein
MVRRSRKHSRHYRVRVRHTRRRGYGRSRSRSRRGGQSIGDPCKRIGDRVSVFRGSSMVTLICDENMKWQQSAPRAIAHTLSVFNRGAVRDSASARDSAVRDSASARDSAVRGSASARGSAVRGSASAHRF